MGFKNVLAIRFMRLGDVVLLLPALTQFKRCYPESRLTLLTDSRCEPLAKLCPALDEVMGVDRLELRDGSRLSAAQSMTTLVREIRRRKFDLVIDFLSFRETNLLAWLSGAPNRLAMKRYDRAYLKFCFNWPPVPEDKKIHVAAMFQRIVAAVVKGEPAESNVTPVLILPADISAWAAAATPAQPFVALYVGAPVPDRRWPAENFAKVARFVLGPFEASVAVLAGAAESAIARKVQQECGETERVRVFDNLSVPQLAAVISRARVLVSNDTGPMHIGPAFDVPTLGLFSVGYPEHYRPLGEQSRFLRSNPIASISVEEVIRNLEAMWSSSPSDSSQRSSIRW